MDNFPDSIKIEIIDIDTNKPISNMAVAIRLFANNKNDYNFLLPISDANGNIKINNEWLVDNIRKTINLFAMDYSSTLEDCKSKFELKILDKEAIKRAIKAKTLYKRALNTKQEEIDKLTQVDNDKYSSFIDIVELHGEKIINVILKISKI